MNCLSGKTHRLCVGTWYEHSLNAIVNAQNRIYDIMFVIKVSISDKGHSSYEMCLLFKCNETNYAKPMFYDLWPTYICDIFSLTCACVGGRLVGKAEFNELFGYCQYADCDKAQYQHSIVYEMLHATQNTRRCWDKKAYLTATPEPIRTHCMK